MAAKDPAIRWLTFSGNGITKIGLKIRFRGTVLVVASGTFGSGTLAGGYLDDTDTFRAFGSSVEVAADGFMELPAGTNMTLALNLTGATTPTIKVGYVGDAFEAI